ncbi:hypothetical protein A9404_04365 [Halothiobacillus diazotrophicus]|uniref:Uncharacterized protein n=1 Tax=Halothiobacillus diazotrophicus TaxID=1860122 RepID=A0A191ZFQ4_9GAMM|nr:hypothetical protein A9404_04365 [Halothiobacillus diazotrophicus]
MQAADFSLVIGLDLILIGPWAVLLDPGIQAVGRDAQSIGNLGHAVTTIRYLPDRFTFEFFGITLAAHEYLSDNHSGWLKGG